MTGWKPFTLARGSRCLTVQGREHFYKLAFWPKAWRQLKWECARTTLAQRDPFWSDFVVPMRCRFPIARSNRLFGPLRLGTPLLQSFADVRRRLLDAQPRRPNHALGCFPTLQAQVIGRVDLKMSRAVDDFLERTHVADASVHGDLHLGNGFEGGGRLRFVDWGNFRRSFVGGYDLLHMTVCALAQQHATSWLVLLDRASPDRLDAASPYPSRTSRVDLACYILARCELEASQDERLGRLSRSRLAKYERGIRLATRYF